MDIVGEFGLLLEDYRSGWKADGLCVDEDARLWFPEGRGAMGEQAKQICARCPVRIECLEFAIDTNEEFGIWGGLSREERNKIARYRRRQQQEIA